MDDEGTASKKIALQAERNEFMVELARLVRGEVEGQEE